ncbi:MAG: glycerate kinase [Verrucomicrobia bacterium]|nr:glycerate kinase [Verrucomicrobiota bacterium]
MRIVIAMDKFKGTLTAARASQAVADGVRQVLPDAQVDMMPIADGGEGTTDAVHTALGGELRHIAVPNAIGTVLVKVPVLFIERDGRKMAVMEMSAAAGINLLRENEYDPVVASTVGVGQMLIYAEEQGAREIVIGIGGSATNDGGSGMATAYGYRFEDASGQPVDNVPEQLQRAVVLRKPPNFVAPKVTVACDVTNPLLGTNGATYIYARQKGASSDALPALESRMEHLADLVSAGMGCDHRDVAGAGAAGGLGFGLMSFLSATLRPGFPLLAEVLRIEDRIAAADAVITGEGSIDAQTCNGKAPMGVAGIARRLGKPVVAIGGQVDADAAAVATLFDHVIGLVNEQTTAEDAMANAASILQQRARVAAEWLLNGSSLRVIDK